MKRLFRLVLLLGAGVLAASVLVAQDAEPVDPEPDVSRFEYVYTTHPVAKTSCGGDTCTTVLPSNISVPIPTSLGTVDVTVLMTMEYETSSGDAAIVSMRMRSPDERWVEMDPGPLALRAGGRTTTTLTWIRQGVAPNDAPHRLSWSLSAAGSSDIPLRIAASEVVLVVEAIPS